MLVLEQVQAERGLPQSVRSVRHAQPVELPSTEIDSQHSGLPRKACAVRARILAGRSYRRVRLEA
ncbi:hypothetical protein GCM10011583_16540 [Streptomyces camponoticapitis]|uniref:Transposase n=1 Tax=Streptomyces camponoticapitis TaxID=1616125 RepID=A0ABQ2E4L0_9ACTN|nr:hypothetical protein GCM10011583_16540 [Streptomyces camponoticapitis]